MAALDKHQMATQGEWTPKPLDVMIAEVREISTAKGFRSGDNTIGDYGALLITEIGEMTDAFRDHGLTDPTGKPTKMWTEPDPPVLIGWQPAKPEGVGSEAADVFIRTLDTCDVFHIPLPPAWLTIEDIPCEAHPPDVVTFGDYTYWLAARAVRLVPADTAGRAVAELLTALRGTCADLGIDLESEYERKSAYNRTRPYQHGRGTLSGRRG